MFSTKATVMIVAWNQVKGHFFITWLGFLGGMMVKNPLSVCAALHKERGLSFLPGTIPQGRLLLIVL